MRMIRQQNKIMSDVYLDHYTDHEYDVYLNQVFFSGYSAKSETVLVRRTGFGRTCGVSVVNSLLQSA